MIRGIFILLLLAGSVFGDNITIDGTTNVEDTQISSTSTGNNYGATEALTLIDSTNVILIRVLGLSSLLPADITVTAAVCSVFDFNHITTGDVSAYSVYKPYGEGVGDNVSAGDGEANWTQFQAGAPALNWGTSGCRCRGVGGDGEDNSQDGVCNGTGRDFNETAESTVNVSGTGWIVFNLSPALVQAWYNETKNEEGILLRGESGDNVVFQIYSTEESTESEKPRFGITYDLAGGGGQKIMIKR